MDMDSRAQISLEMIIVIAAVLGVCLLALKALSDLGKKGTSELSKKGKEVFRKI
jgi:uncharacterized protein (UPF0333 family)